MSGLGLMPPPAQAKTMVVLATETGPAQAPVWRRFLGLWLAPFGIVGLGLLLFLYYRSLDVPHAIDQVGLPLSWHDKLWPQIQTHLFMASWSTVLVVLVAVPLGVLLTRRTFRKITPAVLAVANSGQAFPAYGLLVLLLAFIGSGTTTAILALTLYAILPVLRNTMVGLESVDENVIEAGRGMGLTRFQALTQIELPLAVPVILAGVRTAMILNIGMATLAFLIGGGGLGITISAGLKLQQNSVLIVGSGLVALTALAFDWVGAIAERFLRPRGL